MHNAAPATAHSRSYYLSTHCDSAAGETPRLPSGHVQSGWSRERQLDAVYAYDERRKEKLASYRCHIKPRIQDIWADIRGYHVYKSSVLLELKLLNSALNTALLVGAYQPDARSSADVP